MLNTKRAITLHIFLIPLTLLLAACNAPQEETPTPTQTLLPSPTPRIGVALETLAPPTREIIQVTPTPSPTPTATPTATPIVHIIAEGDTLLALAIANNTTTTEIEALNPGIQANLLQIGQQVILPPPATPSSQSVSSTLVPLDVEVININLYRTPTGSLWLVGEVFNQGQFAAENVQLQIGLSEVSGQGIATIVTWVTPGIIQPQTKAPFGILVPDLNLDANIELAPPSAAIIGGQTLVDTGNRYLDLTVIESEADIEESQVTIEGQIENIGASTAVSILLVTTFYDTQGNVAGFHELSLNFTLNPGEQRPFSIITTPPGGKVSDFSFLVQALRAE